MWDCVSKGSADVGKALQRTYLNLLKFCRLVRTIFRDESESTTKVGGLGANGSRMDVVKSGAS